MESFINSFQKANILVVGDMMIDCYLRGRVNRISPEAPVPIMHIQEREYRLGGAANVALNLKSLGAQPILCSVIGNDEREITIRDLLSRHGLSDDALIFSKDRKTTIKYRIIGNKMQMIRIDDEDDHTLNESDAAQLVTTIEQLVKYKKIGAIIFVDYDKGVLSQETIRSILAIARQHNIMTSVDPKKRNFRYYRGCTLFKPNLKELYEGVNYEADAFDIDNIRQLMKAFAEEESIENIMTTFSEKGIAIYNKQKDFFYWQPAIERSISDVSGAGDTVMAVATLGLLSGLSLENTVQIANLAGGIVCEYAGVVPVTQEMLKDEYLKRTGKRNI